MEKENTFASRLTYLMEYMRLSKSDVAKICGIDKSNITRYCKGEYEAKQDVVYKIARSLNVSEAWLMGYDVPMRQTDQEDPAYKAARVQSSADDDEELLEYLEYLRTRPEARILMSTMRGATKEEVEENVRFIEALRKARREN